MQNCAVCHGVTGAGNGPISKSMAKKPANFTRPFYGAYGDAMWFYRVSEGVAGTRMPRWNKTLSEQDIMYLVAFLKTLPRSGNTPASDIEVVGFGQLDDPTQMDQNYNEITTLDRLHEAYTEGHLERNAPIYGGGRHWGAHRVLAANLAPATLQPLPFAVYFLWWPQGLCCGLLNPGTWMALKTPSTAC